jgi:hypothetical protein
VATHVDNFRFLSAKELGSDMDILGVDLIMGCELVQAVAFYIKNCWL